MRQAIEAHRDCLGASQDEDAALLLADELTAVMQRADPKPHATGAERIFTIEADRVTSLIGIPTQPETILRFDLQTIAATRSCGV